MFACVQCMCVCSSGCHDTVKHIHCISLAHRNSIDTRREGQCSNTPPSDDFLKVPGPKYIVVDVKIVTVWKIVMLHSSSNFAAKKKFTAIKEELSANACDHVESGFSKPRWIRHELSVIYMLICFHWFANLLHVYMFVEHPCKNVLCVDVKCQSVSLCIFFLHSHVLATSRYAQSNHNVVCWWDHCGIAMQISAKQMHSRRWLFPCGELSLVQCFSPGCPWHLFYISAVPAQCLAGDLRFWAGPAFTGCSGIVSAVSNVWTFLTHWQWMH